MISHVRNLLGDCKEKTVDKQNITHRAEIHYYNTNGLQMGSRVAGEAQNLLWTVSITSGS